MNEDERLAAQVATWRAEVSRLNGMIAAATGTQPAASGQQEMPTQGKLREAISDLVRAAEECMQLPKPFRADKRYNEASEELDRVVAALYCAHPAPAQQESEPKECRSDGRCQYAIDHGAEGLGACPVGKCCMPTPAPAPAALTPEKIREIAWEFQAGGDTGKWIFLDGDLPAFAQRLATASAAPADLARDAGRIADYVADNWDLSKKYTLYDIEEGLRAIASQQKGGAS